MLYAMQINVNLLTINVILRVSNKVICLKNIVTITIFFVDEFKHAGQNIFIEYNSNAELNVKEYITKAFDSWFDENKKCDMDKINKGITE